MSNLTSQTIDKANKGANSKAPESRSQFVSSCLLWVTPLFGFWLGSVFGFGLTGKAIFSQLPEAFLLGLLMIGIFALGEIKMLRLMSRTALLSVALQIATIIVLVQRVAFFGRHQYAAIIVALVGAKIILKLVGRSFLGKAAKAEIAAVAARQLAKQTATKSRSSRRRGPRYSNPGAAAPVEVVFGGGNISSDESLTADEPPAPAGPRQRPSGLAERL